MGKLTIIILTLFSLTNCQTKVDTRQKDSAVLIYNETQDSTTIKYNQTIMELPEFKTWKYNSYNSDTIKTIGYSYFEKRKLTINGKTFYHIELIRRKNNKIIDSFIYPEETVCYFRVDPSENIIKILNADTKEFLNLKSEQGRQYFRNCLTK
jgi:uncharacterized protein YcfL